MNFDRLRELILERAIQGKLVPQLESEPEVAKKREEPEKVPFKIPKKWKWYSLGEVVDYGRVEQVDSSFITDNTWVLELEDIEKNTGRLLTKKRGVSSASNKSVFKKGWVLYSKLRPYLNKVIIADEDGICTTEIIPINTEKAKIPLVSEYLQAYLMSPYFLSHANKFAHGVKMPRIGTKDAKTALIPIPPIEEQKRIVRKISDSFKKIQYALDAYNELRELSENLKEQILFRSIQGKLVPQLESEPCIELPDSQLSDRTIDIPKKWKRVKLKDIFTFIDYRGKTPNKIHEGVRLITASNIKQGRMDHSKKVFISNEEYLTRQSRGISKKGDILFTTEAPLGNVAIADIDNYSAGQRIITLQSKKGNNKLYMYFMLSPYFQKLLVSQATGTTAQGIKAARLKELVIPVPPEGEQERILNKLTALFSFLKIYK